MKVEEAEGVSQDKEKELEGMWEGMASSQAHLCIACHELHMGF